VSGTFIMNNYMIKSDSPINGYQARIYLNQMQYRYILKLSWYQKEKFSE